MDGCLLVNTFIFCSIYYLRPGACRLSLCHIQSRLDFPTRPFASFSTFNTGATYTAK
jgi:hypothetical protein